MQCSPLRLVEKMVILAVQSTYFKPRYYTSRVRSQCNVLGCLDQLCKMKIFVWKYQILCVKKMLQSILLQLKILHVWLARHNVAYRWANIHGIDCIYNVFIYCGSKAVRLTLNSRKFSSKQLSWLYNGWCVVSYNI